MSITFTADVGVTINGREVVLIKRMKEPFRDKLCLPGGKQDPRDPNIKETAVREAREEINLVTDARELGNLFMTLDADDRDPRPGHWHSTVFTIDRPHAHGLCAGDDAQTLVIRRLDSLRPEEMGFDHWRVIEALRERHEALPVDALIRKYVRHVPDYPKPGIQFKDITPLLSNARVFEATVLALADACTQWNADVIVGLEARGFIYGGAVAHFLGRAFVPMRKPGKLPAATERIAYDLEYGSAALEIHRDAITAGARVVVIDDLLATGGTAAAAGELVRRVGGTVTGYAFPIELADLGGRIKLGTSAPIHALVTY
ncbi:adenine phosphoribosyltransferase [Candidatus Uhrbacteria bacterium]|nr:adenine phosphoribosyltransferase [Candidatus Uhrbacteria bacterium]